MAESPLKTQHPSSVAIDEAGRTAQGSAQWLLENRKDVPITYGNKLHFMICGEDGFAAIAKDLWEAKSTADIICWGFDPGMELTRGPACWEFDPQMGRERQARGEDGSSDPWPRGVTYGRLLDAITKRKENPVTVRLLIWYDQEASLHQNNMPGFTDVPASWMHPINKKLQQKPPYTSAKRNQYCVDWWKTNLPDGKSGAGANPRLQIVLRSVAKADVQQLLEMQPKEEDKPSTHEDGITEYLGSINETTLLEKYGTHHQKPVLIDYAYDGGSKAVGYVMGLNSVTDFWDRTAHEIDDPLREQWILDNAQTEFQHELETQKPGEATNHAPYRHAKPYQDYACRIVGPALKRVHENFVRGWNAFAPAALRATEVAGLPPNIPTIKPANPAHGVQIVRTQPHEGEKSIKELYFQATSYARNYIYIENQYFFYPEFARHLTKVRGDFCDALISRSDKSMGEIPMLHLFIVIPHPEDEGLVPRTFDTLTELGASSTMPNQAKEVDVGRQSQDYKDAKKGPKGNKILDRPSLQQLQRTLGMKVSVARLRTSGPDANNNMAYREIYIHSKLMLIDDVFVTLGSANLDQRSLSVDSEINVAATGQVWAADLRKRVFELHSGGGISGSGDPSHVPTVFKEWDKRMKKNFELRMTGKPMIGFLLPFEDYRGTTVMHASITVPSSSDTALT